MKGAGDVGIAPFAAGVFFTLGTVAADDSEGGRA